jgi:cytochrome oxidase Cu insertion factor (SCO1/SenC/PrrC family)
MRRPSSHQRRLVILTLTVIVFGIAYFGGSRYQQRNQQLPQISGLAIQPPTPLPDMSEMGEGAPLEPALLEDHWSLLVLDPGISDGRSPALIHLLQIHNRLADKPELQRQLHFLYLPSKADESIQASVSSMDENITGLSGETDQIAETFEHFGVDPESNQAAFYLIGPEQRLHALFTRNQDAATIAQDINTLINHGR